MKNSSEIEKVPVIAKYLSYCFYIIDIFFILILFFIILFTFGAAKEVGDYLAVLYITEIDLVVLLASLKVFNYANNKDFTFISINIIWLFIEAFTFSLAVYYYFTGPDVQYTIIESIHDSEKFAHDKSKAYLYLIWILIIQCLKIFLTSREIAFYFNKKKK